MAEYLGPEKCLEKKKKYIMPCLGHFFTNPPQFVKGSMQYLYDHTGKKYLDCFAGVSVINCGHCNPEITDKVAKQVQTLQHVCNIYLTEDEGALLLANIYNGKSEILALRNGLHGRTKLTMNVTGIGMWRTDPNPVGGIHFAPNPYCYRCPLGKKFPECDYACANAVEDILSYATSGQVSAMICEAIQGNAGIVVPPQGYFKRLKEILEKHDILLIIDEVQTGFARTGKMFAIENFDVEPDIMTMAKALGNGAPISCFISRAEIADKYTRPGASTLGGNPVSSTAGLAVLEYIEKHNLTENARLRGEQLRKGLCELQKKYPVIGDVRGLGLMTGAELVNPDKSPAPEKVDFVVETMKDRGFLIGKNGIARNVLAFQPPLIITEENINDLLNNLGDVLALLK